MLNIIESGTDVAAILIFDPLTLPADYDHPRDDQGDIVHKLHEERRVFLVETGADGGYLVYAYVNEPVADYLKPFLREPVVHQNFEAPSGQIYCTGLEY